jgi:hypothetical protein
MELTFNGASSFDDLDLEGVYVWVMWNDAERAWEKVGVVLVSHPVLSSLVDAALEVENEALALAIVAMGLSLAYGFPKWFDDNGNVRDIWRRSRIIKITDYPEKVNWKISRFTTEKLGFSNELPAFIV